MGLHLVRRHARPTGDVVRVAPGPQAQRVQDAGAVVGARRAMLVCRSSMLPHRRPQQLQDIVRSGDAPGVLLAQQPVAPGGCRTGDGARHRAEGPTE